MKSSCGKPLRKKVYLSKLLAESVVMFIIAVLNPTSAELV